ncbi:hypothetical protein F0562_025320 [Nyssa sinensis]|uniref:Uncharacterized protein n=1 Tax=Nyssa sinensis TaxID=561372 RepID=A0A5J5BJN1_9ASTE|nr:hypothetical protein F0562_025320 [Nyssa sinensis]
MLDPANDLLPQASSPTISSISSSDLDTESTAPRSQHGRRRCGGQCRGNDVGGGGGGRRSRKVKKAALVVAAAAERRRRWWRLCRDEESKPSSLGEFLEVERRFGDGAFYGATAELEGVVTQPRNGRVLFADGRILPPAQPEEGTSTAGALCRFPVSLTGICSGGVG